MSHNVAFYRQYRNAGITAEDILTMVVSAAEDEVRAINGAAAQGHHAAWNYFQSFNTPENRIFVDKFRASYGSNRITDDPIETAYSQVHLWAQSVRKAGSIEVDAIRSAALSQEFESAGGRIRIDPNNLHTWKTVRIGKIQPDGKFRIVYSTKSPLRPEPWNHLLFPDRVCDWTRGGIVDKRN